MIGMIAPDCSLAPYCCLLPVSCVLIMGNLYSRKKKVSAHKVTDQDRAVLDLNNSRDRLTRYQKRVRDEHILHQTVHS